MDSLALLAEDLRSFPLHQKYLIGNSGGECDKQVISHFTVVADSRSFSSNRHNGHYLCKIFIKKIFTFDKEVESVSSIKRSSVSVYLFVPQNLFQFNSTQGSHRTGVLGVK